MSKMGMLGLLEGAGKGMNGIGNAITVNSLKEAQDRREANRERLRREWASSEKADDRTWREGQNEKNYNRNRADNVSDKNDTIARQDQLLEEARGREDSQREENQTNELAKIKARKTTTNGFTLKDAYKQAEKELSGDMSASNLTTDQRKQWIDKRAKELAGNNNGGNLNNQKKLQPETIQKLAAHLNDIDPASRQYEVKKAVEKVGEENVKAAIELLTTQADVKSLKINADIEKRGKEQHQANSYRNDQKQKQQQFDEWLNTDSYGLLEQKIK